MRRVVLGLVAVTALAGAPEEARAYTAAASSQKLFLERYLACRDEPEDAAPPPASRPSDAPLSGYPVPRAKGLPRLEVIPHASDDVAFVEPLPASVAAPRAPMVPDVPTMRASHNDYRCLGYLRGKAGIVRVIDAPPGTRFYRASYDPTWWVQQNIVAAAAFQVTEAIPALQKTLARPHPRTTTSYQEINRIRTSALAATALAELGDRASSPKIRALLVDLETVSLNNVWRDTFRALARSDPAEAGRYGLDVLEKVAANELPLRRAHEFLEVLPYLDPSDRARALPALITLTTKTGLSELSGPYERVACLAFATRLRMGDEALASQVRTPLATSLDTNLSVHCYRELVATLYPGRDVRELPVLLLRRRYRELLELVGRLATDTSPAAPAKRAKVLTELRALGSRSGSATGAHDFHENDRALWLAARAGLGDAAAMRELYAWTDDPSRVSDSAWLALWAALHLDLAGALDHAKTRLTIGIAQRVPSQHEVDLSAGGTAFTARVRVLDELFAKKSNLFALGLVQPDPWARERTLFQLSRRRDASVCGLIAEALPRVTDDDVVDEALYDLTTLGAACGADVERIARDPASSPHLRGMALEHLAMIRSRAAVPLAEAWDPGPGPSREQAARARVKLIARSPE
jgi:hypothetical protein